MANQNNSLDRVSALLDQAYAALTDAVTIMREEDYALAVMNRTMQLEGDIHMLEMLARQRTLRSVH